MFETVAALCIVLGVIALLRFAMVRLGLLRMGATGANRIRVLESASLGLKQQIHLVEIEGRRLILGSSDQGVRLLDRCDPGPEGANDSGDDPAERGATRTSGPRRRGLVSVASTWPGWLPLLTLGVAFLTASGAGAQEVSELSVGGPTVTLSLDGATAPDQLSDTLRIVLILTAISVAPSLLLMATCFTRILIVLALLRQAVGTATLPPNQVLVGLALMTTIYVMTPVAEVVYTDALEPYSAQKIGGEEALQRAIAPVRDYLLAHTREDDLLLFVEMRQKEAPEAVEDVELSSLMPAFMISEIRTAFEIGFMIYLPFLVIDLVIASMLISLGMIMLPPVMIALPFKLMLFVLIDGWNLTLTALVAGLQ